ncbi:uncharacterized protein LOC121729406 isoform X2 [Aricia agestis]|nr:uncharacterized protein LOC121729406 isoform X2 [Aricia agestis]
MATKFAPVCPQSLPTIKKGNPPSLGRQHYLTRIKPFLTHESEDCLYLNVYVPYREQKSKKFPVLVFIHGDSFEWSSGNPYDGRILASYGNVMVITVNFRLGILGFMKPSLTEHVYGNNGLLDQLAALQWIKDNIEDLNGDPHSVTIMGQGTGAACVNYLMLSPISNGLFHRAILMSGSALSDWAMTRDPAQYTLQVAQSLGCSPTSKNMMTCLQNRQLSEIKKVQILAREFETPLGPAVAGSFIPSEPARTMESYPNLLSKYQLLSGVTELESYHDFGVIELDHGILENQRDEFIRKYTKIVLQGAENEALKEILKQYAPTKLDPQRWTVEANREVVLNLLSDARTLAPVVRTANYHASANRQDYFYVFAHNSVSTDYASLNKSVHGEEMPYVLGIPLGGANTHLHSEYTKEEKLLSEVVMRLWTNFVKNGSPNTQSVSEYYTLDRKTWSAYNVEWPEYNVQHQPYLRIDIPPSINSLYRSNYTNFWIDALPSKVKFLIDPLFEFTPPTTAKPKPTHRTTADPVRKIWSQPVFNSPHYSSATSYGSSSSYGSPSYGSVQSYGKLRPYSPPERRAEPDVYREIQAIKTPARPIPSGLIEKVSPTTPKPTVNMPVKTSSATVTLIVSLAVLFVAANISICAVLYYKKRKSRKRDRPFDTRQSRAEIGEVDLIGQKSSKDDKSALKTLKNGCSVIKSMSMNKVHQNSKKIKKKEVCKTPKSDDSGGFRERFQLRRHLSTSTLDAQTKVRDWIANGVLHRCSPNILRKSNSDVNEKSIKPFTRSEELLSDTKKVQNTSTKTTDSLRPTLQKSKTSEKTTSTSALDSHSSLSSNKQSLDRRTGKSNDSLKSKGTDSIKSKKVSVAVDATPAARTTSILSQEPIELTKSFDAIDDKHSKSEIKSETDTRIEPKSSDPLVLNKDNEENKVYSNEIILALETKKPLRVSHKHSTSDPVTDINYEQLMKEKMEDIINILPPVTFRNDINVTSRDENAKIPTQSPEDALMTIKRRNFPKVLPDLPKAQKRLSLQPNSFQTFRSFSSSTESQTDRPRVPPQPPPRTTTLERRLAYKNTKPLSSFEANRNQNYENIDEVSPYTHKPYHKSTELSSDSSDSHQNKIYHSHSREFPKVIIASSDKPSSNESKIIITPSVSHIELPSNIPRVKLPDDFHSHASGSITSFSTYEMSNDEDEDDDDEDFFDDLAEDQLIKELVGGAQSPTGEDVLDSKGPETIFEKKVEIVPVKINTTQPKNTNDYVCVTNLLLPDLTNLEQTAKIKPNFSLNKLKDRSESIHRPPEKAVKVKQRRSIKPAILNKSLRSKSKDDSKLEHSNSGSSNDTESSTGTVRRVDLQK